MLEVYKWQGGYPLDECLTAEVQGQTAAPNQKNDSMPGCLSPATGVRRVGCGPPANEAVPAPTWDARETSCRRRRGHRARVASDGRLEGREIPNDDVLDILRSEVRARPDRYPFTNS